MRKTGVKKMKTIFLLVSLFYLGVEARTFASHPDDMEIRVRHGGFTDEKPTYQILEDLGTIESDPALLDSDSRKDWKQACSDWKKEKSGVSEVISADCGSPNCGKINEYQFICSSVGTRKIRVRVQE